MFEDIDNTPLTSDRPRPVQPAPPSNLPIAPQLPTAPLPEDIFSPADTIPIVSEEPPTITPLGAKQERLPVPPTPPIALPEQGRGGFRKVIVFLLAALVVAFLGIGAYLVYRIIKTRASVDIVNQPIENAGEEASRPETETETPETETPPPPVREEETPEEEEPDETETPPPPQPTDTDNDGLNDLEELAVGSNPRFIDTDMDKLDDYSEVRIYRSDPVLRDTDGDSYDDGLEVQNGYSPTGTGKLNTE